MPTGLGDAGRDAAGTPAGGEAPVWGGAPADAPARTRYRALETVRAYVRDALVECDELDDAEAALVAWAVDAVDAMDRESRGPNEAASDVRLHAELPNLTAAWDAARRRGDLDARLAMVWRLDRLLTFRRPPGPSGWANELVDDPALASHPGRADALAAASHSAWMRGDLDRATALADECRALGDGRATHVALDTIATVRLFRGDAPGAADAWQAAADAAPPDVATPFLVSAALASAYGGDVDRGRALLADVRSGAGQTSPSTLAYADYVEGEIESGLDPDHAADCYGRAIAGARASGAAFVEGVAAVGLVRLWADGGRARQALAGYRALLDSWRRSGHWTQLWTTLRNLAGTLAAAGDSATAALVLAAADGAPEAPRVTADEVATELDALRERLRAELGPAGFADAEARAASSSRVEVLEAALAAIDTALA